MSSSIAIVNNVIVHIISTLSLLSLSLLNYHRNRAWRPWPCARAVLSKRPRARTPRGRCVTRPQRAGGPDVSARPGARYEHRGRAGSVLGPRGTARGPRGFRGMAAYIVLYRLCVIKYIV